MEGRRDWLKTKGFLTQLLTTAKIKCPASDHHGYFLVLLTNSVPLSWQLPRKIDHYPLPIPPPRYPPFVPPVEVWQGTASSFLKKPLPLMGCLPRAQQGEVIRMEVGSKGATSEPRTGKASLRRWHFMGVLINGKESASPTVE